MPIITVQVTKEGTQPGVDHVTAEQKAAIYDGMSQVLADVLGKPQNVDVGHIPGGRDGRLGLERYAGGRISKEARSRFRLGASAGT